MGKNVKKTLRKKGSVITPRAFIEVKGIPKMDEKEIRDLARWVRRMADDIEDKPNKPLLHRYYC